MSSKIGVVLSMLFVVLFFLFGTDLLCLQYQYSELDSKGITIAYYISKNGRIDGDFLSFLSKKYEVEVSADASQSAEYGDVVRFTVKDTYDPLVIANEEMTISISREAIIGYYG